jgi:hypothetical protein
MCGIFSELLFLLCHGFYFFRQTTVVYMYAFCRTNTGKQSVFVIGVNYKFYLFSWSKIEPLHSRLKTETVSSRYKVCANYTVKHSTNYKLTNELPVFLVLLLSVRLMTIKKFPTFNPGLYTAWSPRELKVWMQPTHHCFTVDKATGAWSYPLISV